MYNKKLEYWS